jgi:ubiquinone/menaquinone biosynthesis C-methylase UbiE
MSFDEDILNRSAAEYADFFLPHLTREMVVLDGGCGSGTITVGLADQVASIVGVDREVEFSDAAGYVDAVGASGISFQTGDLYSLEFPDAHFDACLCHSALEALTDPLRALAEIARVLKPGAVVGVASVEYGGIIIAGDNVEPLRRFYQIREKLWELEDVANPYLGRNLRGLLNKIGFKDVIATTKYFSYGTADSVAEFGSGRAADCVDRWYSNSAVSHGLASSDELKDIKRAWESWSQSPSAYLAFPWCRAIGWKE